MTRHNDSLQLEWRTRLNAETMLLIEEEKHGYGSWKVIHIHVCASRNDAIVLAVGLLSKRIEATAQNLEELHNQQLAEDSLEESLSF